MQLKKWLIAPLMMGAWISDALAEDISKADTLDTAVITAEKGVIVSRADTVQIGTDSDADRVLSGIPGVTLTDMGGAAGLKTVSMRGLGSNHTAVYIDGIRVGNIQSGQTDLGMIGTETCSHIILDYAQNSINFITASPTFSNRRIAGNASMKAGSFGTYQPSVRIDWKAGERLSLSISADGNISKGDFPYPYGGERLRRSNNDIGQIRSGIDLFGLMDRGKWHVKGYFNSTERGTPGSVTWPSEDSQKDMNVFIQGNVRKEFGEKYIMNASAKAALDRLDYISSWGNSNYDQSEIQLNTSHIYKIRDWWSISFALAGTWDRLESGSYEDGDMTRISLITAVSTSIRYGRFRTEIALEYFGASDKTWKDALSPSVSLGYTAGDGLEIIASARRAYRIPTFNELYYIGYGNPDLHNEDAWLSDIGISWTRRISDSWMLKAKANGFANWLSDKITSAPSIDNPAIWLPYNIGKVSIYGTDISASAEFDHEDWHGGLTCGFVFQDATDRTPDSPAYGQQIPYVARHTANAKAAGAYKGWRITLTWNSRNSLKDNTGDIPDWNTLDIMADKEFTLSGKHGIKTKVFVMLNNVTDCRYELSGGYPMPGINWKAGVGITF